MLEIIKKLILALLPLTVIACSSTQQKAPQQKAIQQKVFQERNTYIESGKASFYAMKYHGRKTASGERFDQTARTAAHKTLPFGTKVKVTNLKNSRKVVVRINDRGPFVKGRIIDLSKSAFASIGNTRSGVIPVAIEVIQ